MTHFLSSRHIHRLVSQIGVHVLMDELICALEKAFLNYSADETKTVPRRGFVQESGLLEWMPVQEQGGYTALKLVGYQPQNPLKEGIPSIQASVGLYNAKTGQMDCLLEGTLLTAMRTGAASAIATRHLACSRSEVLGILGCGCQSMTQLHALSRISDWKQILAYDIQPGCAERFIRRIGELGYGSNVKCVSLDELAEKSDVICTATSHPAGAGPILGASLIKRSRVHINAVGADFPGKIELGRDLLRKAFVVPDYLPQALAEGECQQLLPEEIGPDLVTCLKHGNSADYSGITVFDSTGWALEDLVAAKLFLAHAKRLGIGESLELHSQFGDVKDPYSFLPCPAEQEGRLSLPAMGTPLVVQGTQ